VSFGMLSFIIALLDPLFTLSMAKLKYPLVAR
jgi:hypothetical protein